MRDATILAHWCAKSDTLYNIGAKQTAILLEAPEFITEVANELAALGLLDDCPAVQVWGKGGPA